jgi:hypothetical protein
MAPIDKLGRNLAELSSGVGQTEGLVHAPGVVTFYDRTGDEFADRRRKRDA